MVANLRTGLILGILLLAPGCGDAPPAPPDDLGRFTRYYAGEMFVVERNRIGGGDDGALSGGLDSLRRAHGITRGRRDTLLAYLKDSLPRWEAFLKDVLEELEAKGTGSSEGGPGA